MNQDKHTHTEEMGVVHAQENLVETATQTVETATQTVARWRENPSMVDENDHKSLCDGSVGYIYPNNITTRCPICEYKRSLELMLIQAKKSGIDERYLRVKWRDLRVLKPFDIIENSCQKLNLIRQEGQSLVLLGPTGSGKTQAGMLILKTGLSLGFTVQVINIGKLCLEIRHGFNKPDGMTEFEGLNLLTECDILMLDDIGVGESVSGTMEAKMLYLALEARNHALKPTVVTTNLNFVDFNNLLGDRIVERLMPFTTLSFNHGVNFRAEREAAREVLWSLSNE